MLFHSNQAEKRQQNNYVDSWLGRKQTAAGSPASSPDGVRLWKWWGLFTIIVYLAQVSGFTDSFFCKDNWNVHICSNIVCNSHITGPLAGESTAEQLFKVHLFPPTNDGLWISSWVNAKSFLTASSITKVRIIQFPCTQVCYWSHPEQRVSAVRPRCRWCEAGRSGEPGSGHRCWTCTAEPGWYLKSQSNVTN